MMNHRQVYYIHVHVVLSIQLNVTCRLPFSVDTIMVS